MGTAKEMKSFHVRRDSPFHQKKCIVATKKLQNTLDKILKTVYNIVCAFCHRLSRIHLQQSGIIYVQYLF